MFTQCSKCETVFRLSAEVLRLAGGQVRCGKCGEVFNALARLAEEPGAFAVGEGESALELETRADQILESAPPPRPQEPPDAGESETQIARLEVDDWEPDPTPAEGASLEFTLPPGELDRIFVENRQALKFLAEAAAESRSSRSAGTRDAVARPATDGPAAPMPATPDVSAVPAAPDNAGIAAANGDEYTRDGAPGGGARDVPQHAGDVESDADFGDTDASGKNSRIFARVARRGDRGANVPSVSGQDLSEELRREVQDGIAQANRPVFLQEPRRSFVAGWVAGAFVGAALLAVQLIHQNREWLAAREPFGDAVRALYAVVGAPLAATPNLAVYQLRQWGVTGDPGADGTLRVRASILNVTSGVQPYPELRVTLADRFGNRIGSRDFEPGEYLARPPAKLMAAGERADATLEIQDPGRNAEGFEFDVCLHSTAQRVLCANDAMAHLR